MSSASSVTCATPPLITVGGPSALYPLVTSQRVIEKLHKYRKKIITLYQQPGAAKLHRVIKYIDKKLRAADNDILKLDLLDHRAYFHEQQGAYTRALTDLEICVRLNSNLCNSRPNPHTCRKIFYKPGRLGLDSVNNYKKQMLRILLHLKDYPPAVRLCAEFPAAQQAPLRRHIRQQREENSRTAER